MHVFSEFFCQCPPPLSRNIFRGVKNKGIFNFFSYLVRGIYFPQHDKLFIGAKQQKEQTDRQENRLGSEK